VHKVGNKIEQLITVYDRR